MVDEFAHARPDLAQVLGDDFQVRQRLLHAPKQRLARGLDPLALAGGGAGGGDGVVVGKADEVVDAQPVEHRPRRVQAAQPPAEAVAAHLLPVVEGVAPALPVGAEVIRRHAGHAQGSKVLFVQLEKLRLRPGVGGILGHVDGHVAKEGDALCVYVILQRLPLAEEQPLAVAVKVGALLKGRGVHAPHVLIFLRPLRPHSPAAGILDGGVEGVGVQPVDVFLAVRRPRLPRGKFAHILLNARKRLLKRQAQERLLARAHIGEVHAVGIGSGVGQFRVEQPFLAQQFQVDEHRVARVRRAGLVGRFAVSRRPDGQHLPHAQPRLFHKVGKGVSLLAQRAYAAGGGQRGHVHQHAALAHADRLHIKRSHPLYTVAKHFEREISGRKGQRNSAFPSVFVAGRLSVALG